MSAKSQLNQDVLNNALAEANKKLKNMPAPSKQKDEVNFDDISSDSSDEDIEKPDEKDNDSTSSAENYSFEEKLTRAESSKETGNGFYKENKNKKAREFYQKGLDVLDSLEDKHDMNPTDKEKYIKILISLQLNKAASCNKLKEYQETIKACTLVIKKAGSNSDFKASRVKALLRRGLAQYEQNEITGAKKDLMEVLNLDKTNKDALRQLRKVKAAIIDQKKRAKDTFGDIFKKDIKIYKDKDDELKRRQVQKKKELAKKRKLYEEEKEKSDNTAEFPSFDDWTKERAEKEKEKERKKNEEKEEKERKREEKRRKKREEERKKKIENGIDPDADEVELDEEDLAAIAEVKQKGYCHFRREKTEDEEKLLSNIAPSKIVDSSASSLDHLPSKESEHSAWNQGKTWEEKDVSEKVKKKLKEKLKEVSLKNNSSKTCKISIDTDKVSSVTGDCQVVFVSGKKGTVYDMSLELKFKVIVVDSDSKEKKLAGKLKFPEIANGTKEHNFEASCTISRLNSLTEEEKGALQQVYQRYEETIREYIYQLVEGEYKGSS